MTPTQDLALTSTDPTASRSRLVCGGAVVASIPGVAMHAQYRLQDGRRLVVTADDTLAGDVANVLLFSPSFELLDLLSLGGAYAPMDMLSNVVPRGADSVHFDFLGRGMLEFIQRQSASIAFRDARRSRPVCLDQRNDG